jgi:soluble lytic murein transglycosylase-like protein
MYRRTVRRGLGSASITSIQSLITSVANQLGVPPSIALAVAQKESEFNQAAVGSAGEIGVMQLMPATAAGLGVDPSDLNQNVTGGVSLLASLYQQFGNWSDALAAYNAGPTHLAAGQSYASSVLTIADNGGDLFTASDSFTLPDLSSDSGTSPWLWVGVAVAGLGLLWWATA